MTGGAGRQGPTTVTWLALASVFVCGGIVLVPFLLVFAVTASLSGDNGAAGDRTIGDTSGIPAEYVDLITTAADAAGCPEVTPALLAAQLRQESGFDPDAQSPVGAMGIAQFMPGTWATHGVGDVWDPVDAVPAAARYDCAVARQVAAVPGDRQELMLAGYNAGPSAVLRYQGVPPYTETRDYVRSILAQAQVYGDAPAGDELVGELVDLEVLGPVLAFMEGEVGKPYVWGAEGPGAWDCSSLVRAAYRTIGVDLPRVTVDQLDAGPRVSPTDPQPGDLLFVPGTDGTVKAPGHVGMYAGDGRVIAAKGARWGVVVSALSDWTTIVAVTRPAVGRVE